MKKLIAVVLALICVFVSVGCNNEKGQSYFTGKVKEVNANYLLVEITDSGNSGISVGANVIVSTEVVSADGCPDFVADEHARVVFNGEVMEKDPASLGTVFALYKIDETGNVTTE